MTVESNLNRFCSIFLNKVHMKAVLYILTAFGLGTIKTVLVKSMSSNTPISLVVFLQFFLCTIFCIPQIIKTRGQVLISHRIFKLITRGIVGIAYWYTMFLAVNYLSLFNLSTLINLSPLWVLVITNLSERTSINKNLFKIAVLGFTGCTLILKPSTEIFHVGAVFGLLSGIFMALTIVLTKNLLRTEKSHTVIIYYFCVASCSLFPLVIKSDLQCIPIYDWFLMSINAILMLMHQLFLNKGLSLGLSTELSILAYSNVLFSLILDLIIWQEVPDLISIIGAIMIVSSGTYIIQKQKISNFTK